MVYALHPSSPPRFFPLKFSLNPLRSSPPHLRLNFYLFSGQPPFFVNLQFLPGSSLADDSYPMLCNFVVFFPVSSPSADTTLLFRLGLHPDAIAPRPPGCFHNADRGAQNEPEYRDLFQKPSHPGLWPLGNPTSPSSS